MQSKVSEISEISDDDSDEYVKIRKSQSKYFYFCCPYLIKYPHHHHKNYVSDDSLNIEREGEYFIEKLAIRRIHADNFKETTLKQKKIIHTKAETNKEKRRRTMRNVKKESEKKNESDEKMKKKTSKTHRAFELLKLNKPSTDGRGFSKQSTNRETDSGIVARDENKKLKILYYKDDEIVQKMSENTTSSIDKNRELLTAHPSTSDTKPTKLNWKIVIKRYKAGTTHQN